MAKWLKLHAVWIFSTWPVHVTTLPCETHML